MASAQPIGPVWIYGNARTNGGVELRRLFPMHEPGGAWNLRRLTEVRHAAQHLRLVRIRIAVAADDEHRNGELARLGVERTEPMGVPFAFFTTTLQSRL